MKICLTVNSSPWTNLKGGGNIAVHYLAVSLTELGHDVTVVYSKRPHDLVSQQVPYKIVWARHYDVATINLNIFSFRSVIQTLLSREPFDIVHGNGEEALFVSQVCRKRKIPFVYTSHANLLPHVGMAQGMLNPIRFLKSVNQYLQRATALRADRVITYSQFSSELVARALASSCPPVDVVSPGVDPAWFDVCPEPASHPVFLIWGRMEEQKGVSDLLMAFEKVHQSETQTKLWIVGEGSQMEQYQTMAKSLGLGSSVEFYGWQSLESIRKMAAGATACVFPSRVESFGLAMAEALATGVPVIATRVGALSELIESGVTGTLVPPKDIPGLAGAMSAVLEDPSRFQEQARKARESVRKRFSWEQAARQMSAIYQDQTRGF